MQIQKNTCELLHRTVLLEIFRLWHSAWEKTGYHVKSRGLQEFCSLENMWINYGFSVWLIPISELGKHCRATQGLGWNGVWKMQDLSTRWQHCQHLLTRGSSVCISTKLSCNNRVKKTEPFANESIVFHLNQNSSQSNIYKLVLYFIINFTDASFNSQLWLFCPELWVSQRSSNYRFGFRSHLLALIWDKLNIFFFIDPKIKAELALSAEQRRLNMTHISIFRLTARLGCVYSIFLSLCATEMVSVQRVIPLPVVHSPRDKCSWGTSWRHQTPSPYLHPQTPRADLQKKKQKHTHIQRTHTHALYQLFLNTLS